MSKTPLALFIRFKALLVIGNLLRTTDWKILFEGKKIQKYYSLYVQHQTTQIAQFKANLQQAQNHQQQLDYKQKIKDVYETYAQKLTNKVNDTTKQLKQTQPSVYETQARNILHTGMEYLSLYYESLQNMIEGRRQVLHDQGFKFEDGQSVQQKRLWFQSYLSRLLGRSKSEMQNTMNISSKKQLKEDISE